MQKTVESTWWTLRLTFGIVPIVAGLDKFLGLLTDWQAYLSPLARSLMPVSPATFMHVVGIIEIAAGLLVLSRWTRLGAFVVSAWLVGIALQLVTSGRFLDVAVRDLVMAVGAYALARLSEVRERRAAPETRPVPAGAAAARA